MASARRHRLFIAAADETQALLDLLVQQSKGVPLMLLVSYRPEYRHKWSSQVHYQELRVDPLGDSSSEEMIVSVLSPLATSTQDENQQCTLTGDSPARGADSVSTLGKIIIERTAGNPLFIEEMVRALIDQGVLKHNGAFHLNRPVSEIKTPSTVHGILAARVDGLAPPEKKLVQTLTVGSVFTVTLARRVTM